MLKKFSHFIPPVRSEVWTDRTATPDQAFAVLLDLLAGKLSVGRIKCPSH